MAIDAARPATGRTFLERRRNLQSRWMRLLQVLNDACFRAGMPHVLNVLGLIVGGLMLIVAALLVQ
jgi:hypothetical protein